ncbi:MAG TPA: hypothetical protein VF384_08665 [Planctomycetota bacterium]
MRRTFAIAVCSLLAACSLDYLAETAETAEPELREREEHNPGGVRQRAQMRSPKGQVPHDALVQAWQQKEQMAMFDDLGAPVQWTWLGPGNIGGRLRAVLIDPANPQRIWVGSAGGGVFYSDTGGASWQPRNGLLTMLGCGCMALDPTNSNHLYFGSGEGFFDAEQGTSNTAILRGAGIFESFDAGVTWTRIMSTSTPDWYFVNRLAFQPGNALVMLAATASGIWRSTNGGQTWTQRTATRTLDLRFHPTDPLRAVAGRHDGRAQWTTDGGLTWNTVQISAIATRVELAYARSNPTTVYATVSDTSWFVHVWRSLDGGQTWAQRSSTSIGTYSLYNNCLWVDPTNANNLVYGGVQLYRSTDAGATRTQFTSGSHPDYHAIVEHPGYNGTTNKRIYTGDDGGLHTITDWQVGSWTALNSGLGVTQFYGAAMNPVSSVMIAGAQDNGTSRFNGNPNVWTYNIIGGDGGFCAADQTDPNYFYGGYQYLGLQRSSNQGVGWTDIRGTTTSDPGFNFIPYFLLDPNNQSRMIACGRALWRTNNVKTGNPPAWTQIKAPRICPTLTGPASAHFQENPFCNHSTAQIAVGNSDVIWVGHNDGEVHRTSNGTAAAPVWTLVDSPAGGLLPDRWVSSIAIDPSNHQRVILSMMGYTPDNLWETLDNGVTWHTIDGSGTGALPDLPISWVVMHPVLHNLLFVATDLGLFHSTNGGASWAPIAGGPENVCIDQLIWKNDRDLLCVTHGRGVYQARLPLAGTQPVGTGCATLTPPVLAATSPIVGTTMQFSLASAQPNAFVFRAISMGPPIQVPVGPCTVHIDLSIGVIDLAGTTSGTGAWSSPLFLPPFPELIGQQLSAQALLLVAGGGPMLGLGDLSTGLHVFLGL